MIKWAGLFSYLFVFGKCMYDIRHLWQVFVSCGSLSKGNTHTTNGYQIKNGEFAKFK